VGGTHVTKESRLLIPRSLGTALSTQRRPSAARPSTSATTILRRPSEQMGAAVSSTSVTSFSSMTMARKLELVAPDFTRASDATTPSAWASSEGGSAFGKVWELTRLVEGSNACALDGCTIKYDAFMPIMWRAVQRGFVEHDHAVFVAEGLRNGFTAGVQRHLLRGQRVFKNYKSAVEAMPQVTRATQKRLGAGKTICLGSWVEMRDALSREIRDFYLFPIGAVPKPLEPTEVRPASDHTKTGLNGATVLGILQHTLTAQADVAWLLKTGYFMYVSDVEAAFPMLPLAPWLWWFMLHRVPLPECNGWEGVCGTLVAAQHGQGLLFL
jgi:hypothetical protein